MSSLFYLLPTQKVVSLPQSLLQAPSCPTPLFSPSCPTPPPQAVLLYSPPLPQGYLVNWDHQKTVWDYLFGKQCFGLKPEDTNLVFTEPFFNFMSIQVGGNGRIYFTVLAPSGGPFRNVL